MKKYIIIGSYSVTEVSTIKTDLSCTVVVPLVAHENTLKYGLGQAINKLLIKGIIPSEDGIDFLCLATLIYLADTRISRELHSQDSWTREIAISLPVHNLDKWNRSVDTITRMLNFLTGDLWKIAFSCRDFKLAPFPNPLITPLEINAVTLFSGGMDSLIAAIDFLEDRAKIAFISHASDPYTKKSQRKLLSHFQNQYPHNAPTYFDLWTSFGDDFANIGGGENSTRSRSFLFISYGICVLSGVTTTSTLYVPENALIALNVPLDSLRIGSHSTKTTHPFYLHSWNRLLANMEIGISILNPYWNKTKGEMANECHNKELLRTIISDSISCSSPQKVRYQKVSPQHCGYCVPCLIRRAAMTKAFGIGNDPTRYYFEKILNIQKDHTTAKGIQLRSFELAIHRIHETPALAKLLIHKSGPIEGDSTYIDQLADVYLRGMQEVEEFIRLSIECEKI